MWRNLKKLKYLDDALFFPIAYFIEKINQYDVKTPLFIKKGEPPKIKEN